MTESIILTIVGIAVSIIGFFIVRWMNGVDTVMKDVQEKLKSLEEKVDSKLASVDDLRCNAVHRNTCQVNHQNVIKQIIRERYRITDLVERLERGDYTKKTPRKSFYEIGQENEQRRNPPQRERK